MIVPRALWQAAQEVHERSDTWLSPGELVAAVTTDPEVRSLMLAEWALYEDDPADVLDQLCLCVACERHEADDGEDVCSTCLEEAEEDPMWLAKKEMEA